MLRQSLTVFFLSWITIAVSQTTMMDSLKEKIAGAGNEAGKLKAIMAFCDQWDSFNKDTLHRYAMMAEQMAARQKNAKAGFYARYYISAWLLQENKLDTALNSVNELIASVKNALPYCDLFVKLYRLKSNILSRGLHMNELAANAFGLLKLAEANNDTIGMISARTSIGNANTRMEKYGEAIRWHKQALELMDYPFYKRKMSLVYSNIAIDYADTGKYDSAEYYLKQSIKYAKENNNLTDESAAWAIYGNVLSNEGKLSGAETALKNSVQLQQQIGDSYYTISGMNQLANFYVHNKDYGKGISEFLVALDISHKNGSPFSENIQLYEDISSAYKKSGNYQKANEFLELEIAAMDSAYQSNSATALAEMQAKYETQKKETTILRQNYELNKERYFRYAIIGFIVVLLTIVFLVARYKKHQQELKIKEMVMANEWKTQHAVETAKAEERTRIIADLHDDVGGGLSTIRMVSDLMVGQHEHTRQLEEYAHKISGITKDVTQRMNTIVWALNADNDNLQNLWEYIRGYGFRFFEDTDIAFECDLPDVMSDIQLSGLRRKNIFLCVKEALNNVYKHSGAKKSWITISLADGLLTISINDDGKGINVENRLGNGLKNIKKRMREINGDVEFVSTSQTSVVLKINLG